MVLSHPAHLPLGALLSWCAVCAAQVTPLMPVKKSAFVLKVGDETAIVDWCRGAAPCHGGIVAKFKGLGFVELKLHGDAGDLELWLYSSFFVSNWGGVDGKPAPFDVPKSTVVRVTFPSHENKSVEMRVRNGEKNEDEQGNANMRNGGTNYFIFPGESGQDPSWLKDEKWRGHATVAFEVDGKPYACEPFVLCAHEAL